MSHTVDSLFAHFKSDPSTSVVCFVADSGAAASARGCFVEVYNEVLRDLGSPDGREGMLDLREDPVTGRSET